MGRIRTWRCGEVGVEGTRIVLDGGRFKIGPRLYQSDRLIILVGEIIHFHDFDDLKNRIAIHRCSFERGRTKRERLIVGDSLGYAHEVE